MWTEWFDESVHKYVAACSLEYLPTQSERLPFMLSCKIMVILQSPSRVKWFEMKEWEPVQLEFV